MSMLLPQMEKRGLLQRRPDQKDKRVLRLSLTDAGRALSEEAMRIQTELIEHTLSATPVDECQRLADNMDLLVQRMLSSDDMQDLEISEDRG